jgi:metallo-beta-lactamase class B
MNKRSGQVYCFVAALLVFAGSGQAQSAQGAGREAGPPDHPTIVVNGKTYTPASIVGRNMGSKEEQTTPVKPYKIISNVYYVGTQTLSSFLIVTPAGNILMNDTYESNVPIIKKSVEDLGFKFTDTKIVLGNHGHNDHMEGDALVKELTGAKVISMAEEVPALKALKPGGKEHPIDEIIHDGDSVSLGGTTLLAHLTPGHTRGCTTWTMKADDGGKTYDVVFHCSLRISGQNANKPIPPYIVSEFMRSFPIVRSLPCDVPLGDHPSQYSLQEKAAKMRPGGPNPFIDPMGCNIETDLEEAMFAAVLLEQESATR